MFKRVSLIGIGLINSSVARVIRKHELADEIVCVSRRQETIDKALELGIVDRATPELAEAVSGADFVVLGTPVGTYGKLAAEMGPHLAPGAIVTDVGSVKAAVIRDVSPHIPEGVHFVPGHPVAGTEHSGPEAGFAELFEGRWCILTPTEDTAPEATEKVSRFWQTAGSTVEILTADHHDQVLAITSHLPHLLAYNIVGTVADLELSTRKEVVKYAAGGFRDFTRIAASDPEMWRDVFLNNQEAVLEMLGRFTEDLAALQRAIRWGDGDKLEAMFTRTRAIRRGVIDAKQA